VHHVYIGGLLDHSLCMARMGMAAVSFIGGDRDIVIAGSILHDIGKTQELDITRGFHVHRPGAGSRHITLVS
jgi:3'-5' exoribonuclease